jgi:hypothetical protein
MAESILTEASRRNRYRKRFAILKKDVDGSHRLHIWGVVKSDTRPKETKCDAVVYRGEGQED